MLARVTKTWREVNVWVNSANSTFDVTEAAALVVLLAYAHTFRWDQSPIGASRFVIQLLD